MFHAFVGINWCVVAIQQHTGNDDMNNIVYGSAYCASLQCALGLESVLKYGFESMEWPCGDFQTRPSQNPTKQNR